MDEDETFIRLKYDNAFDALDDLINDKFEFTEKQKQIIFKWFSDVEHEILRIK